MIYRVYLRAPDQSVQEKTVTSDPEVARYAFKVLTERLDLDGSQMLAVLNHNGAPIAHHRFDGLDSQKYWRHRTPQIKLNVG